MYGITLSEFGISKFEIRALEVANGAMEVAVHMRTCMRGGAGLVGGSVSCAHVHVLALLAFGWQVKQVKQANSSCAHMTLRTTSSGPR